METKIYFISPSNAEPTGGVKQIYKMVEILNENGINAVLLLKKRADVKWFTTNVPVEISPYLFKKIKLSYLNQSPTMLEKIHLFFLKQRSIDIQPDSILVFPEIYGPNINKIEPSVKKVIFNQNCYYSRHQYQNEDLKDNPYSSKNTLGTIVVSTDSYKYIKFTIPQHKTFLQRIGVNTEIFCFSDKKEKIISYMPRKLREDSNQIINILKIRNQVPGWRIVAIENKNESEVAEILKESAIFLSFNHREGFGLPPLEAMSCGCYIIGYHGEGGKEYLNSTNSSLIEMGNILGFVQEIETIAKKIDQKDHDIQNMVRMNSNFVRKYFSL